MIFFSLNPNTSVVLYVEDEDGPWGPWEGTFSMDRSGVGKMVYSLDSYTYIIFEGSSIYIGVVDGGEDLAGYKASVTLSNISVSDEFVKAVMMVVND